MNMQILHSPLYPAKQPRLRPEGKVSRFLADRIAQLVYTIIVICTEYLVNRRYADDFLPVICKERAYVHTDFLIRIFHNVPIKL